MSVSGNLGCSRSECESEQAVWPSEAEWPGSSGWMVLLEFEREEEAEAVWPSEANRHFQNWGSEL